MESLSPENYLMNPYGIICEVNQTKLFFHSRKQTYNKMKDWYVKTINVEEGKLEFDENLSETY